MPAVRRASPPQLRQDVNHPCAAADRASGPADLASGWAAGSGAAVARAVGVPAAADRAPVATAAGCVLWGRSSLALHSQRRRPGLDVAVIRTPPRRNGLPAASLSRTPQPTRSRDDKMKKESALAVLLPSGRPRPPPRIVPFTSLPSRRSWPRRPWRRDRWR